MAKSLDMVVFLKTNMKQFSDGLGKAGKTLKGHVKAWHKEISGVMLALSAIGFAGATKAVEEALDLEAVKKKIATIPGMRKEMEDKIYKNARAASDKYGVEYAKILDNTYNMLSGTNMSIDEVANNIDGLALLTRAGFGTYEDSAQLHMKLVNVYGKEADALDVLADKIINTQNAGDITVPGISKVVSGAGAESEGAGITQDELLALTATLAKYQSPEKTGTRIKALANSVTGLTGEGEDTADAFGLEFSIAAVKEEGYIPWLLDVIDTVYKNNDALFARKQALNAEIEQMKKNGVATDEQKTRLKELEAEFKTLEGVGRSAGDTLATLFPNQEARGAVQQIIKGREALEKTLVTALTGGQAQEAYDDWAENNVGYAMEKAKTRIDNLAGDVGEVLLPEMEKFFNTINPMLESLAKWIDANPKAFERIVKALTALSVLGGIVGALGLTGGGLALLKKGLAILLIILGSPILIGITLLTMGLSAFLQMFISGDWKKNWISKLVDLIPGAKESIDWFFDQVVKVFDSFRIVLDKSIKCWKEVCSRVVDFTKEILYIVGDWIADKFKWIVDIGKKVFSKLKDVILSPFQAAITGIIKGVNYMIEKINSINIKIPDVVPKIGGKTIGFDLPKVKVPEFEKGGWMKQSGLALVGEKGPELVGMTRGSRIYPNSDLQGVGADRINISMNGLTVREDADVDRIARKLGDQIRKNSLKRKGMRV